MTTDGQPVSGRYDAPVPSRRRRGFHLSRRWVLAAPAGIIAVLAIALLAYSRIPVGTAPAKVLQASGVAMEPTIKSGTRVVAHPAPAALERGAIVVFTARPEVLAVSRVVAIPGDTIEAREGHLIINGAVVNEPYVSEPMNYTIPPTHLAAGQYYLLGDNRNHATGSNTLGPLPRDRILGIVSL